MVKSIEQFDYEHFDYNECFNTVRENFQKPNILICGATGVGKSSLINDILSLSEYNRAEVGNDGRPKTRGIHKYCSDEDNIVIYDSEGYEIENTQSFNDFEKDVIGFIDQKKRDNSTDINEWIHVAWYCVSAANKRFFEYDEELIRTIRSKNIPIIVIITKVDLSLEEELSSLIRTIKRKLEDVPIFTFSTEISDDNENYIKYVQKEEIINWTAGNLDESLRGGFLSAVKNAISIKRNYALKKVVPTYTASAAATVLGTTFVPVPFSDSVPLMAIQTTMTMHIMNVYNIHSNIGDAVKGVVGTSLISYVGRTIASKLIGLVPVVGKGTEIAVNTTVATTITATLGCAITVICERYLAKCIEKEGNENLSFETFFTSDNLKDAVKYVKEHKDEFDIAKIIGNGKNSQ